MGCTDTKTLYLHATQEEIKCMISQEDWLNGFHHYNYELSGEYGNGTAASVTIHINERAGSRWMETTTLVKNKKEGWSQSRHCPLKPATQRFTVQGTEYVINLEGVDVP